MTTSTANFSIPEDLKREFNEAFPSENKSAVIAGLMRHAIEERKRQRRRAAAIDALLRLRRSQRPVAAREVSAARRKGRP
jgi:metal-responsive CopG/Arc/MetJ family transcriptional regulator